MFLQLSVILFTRGGGSLGGLCPGGLILGGLCPEGVSVREIPRMHPTGMHSCFGDVERIFLVRTSESAYCLNF